MLANLRSLHRFGCKQFKRARKQLRKLRTMLGRVRRDIGRKIAGDARLEEAFARPLMLARRVAEQRRGERGPKVYALHAPEVECIGKGKSHKPFEFGVKSLPPRRRGSPWRRFSTARPAASSPSM